MPPSPIPASTIASIMANAVGVETTYSRKNRNQITSSDKRMQPVPKLMKSIRHGGQYLAHKRRGSVRSGTSAGVFLSICVISKATTAAMQLAKAAAKLVPEEVRR